MKKTFGFGRFIAILIVTFFFIWGVGDFTMQLLSHAKRSGTENLQCVKRVDLTTFVYEQVVPWIPSEERMYTDEEHKYVCEAMLRGSIHIPDFIESCKVEYGVCVQEVVA